MRANMTWLLWSPIFLKMAPAPTLIPSAAPVIATALSPISQTWFSFCLNTLSWLESSSGKVLLLVQQELWTSVGDEENMEQVLGAVGTSASLALWLGQTLFSTASLLFMCLDIDFYSYTAFCYLVIFMGLVIPWSLTLVLVDAYSVFIKCLPHQQKILTKHR